MLSAYMAMLERPLPGRSLMNKREKVRPRIQPYGTPASITNSGDVLQSNTTLSL